MEEYYTKEEALQISNETERPRHFKDISGLVFGRLKVLYYAGKEGLKGSYWFCECQNCKRIIRERSSDIQSERRPFCRTCSNSSPKRETFEEYTLEEKSFIAEAVYDATMLDKRAFEKVCNKCDEVVRCTWRDLRSGRLPHRCKAARNKKTPLEIKEVVTKFCTEYDIKALNEVQEYNNKTYFQCNVCSYEFNKRTSAVPLATGCPKCQGKAPNTQEDFFKAVAETQTIQYDYSKAVYTGIDDKVTIICPTHGEFQQVAYDHMIGRGCMKCCGRGYDSSKPGTLYITELTNTQKTVLKIGITNRPTHERMAQHSKGSSFEHSIIKEYFFNDGTIPRQLETALKQNFTCGIVSREELPDGFCETFRKDDENDIINFIQNFQR